MNDFIDQCSISFILVHLRPSYDVGNVHLLPISQYLLFSRVGIKPGFYHTAQPGGFYGFYEGGFMGFMGFMWVL